VEDVPQFHFQVSNILHFFSLFFVAEDGSVWSWGWNYQGRVGNGKTDDVNSVVPECVSLLKGKNIINLWSMAHSTIVLCDGTHILNTFFFLI
jgi:alpha-tubulin suppressor-like RCC1 family protein